MSQVKMLDTDRDDPFIGIFDNEREARIAVLDSAEAELPNKYEIHNYFESLEEWREAWTGDRECPACGNDRVVSKREAERVYNWDISDPYICSYCHVGQ